MVKWKRPLGLAGLSQTWPKVKGLPWLSCLILFSPAAFPQALPQINPGGVVNAASFAQPISPGSLVSIFGSNLAATTMTAHGTPLPTDLAETSVTVNGTRAPLLFVSPSQINLQAPSNLQVSYSAYTQAAVVVTTTVGSSAAVQVPAYLTSPAVFTMDGSGCGQAAALNISADGSVSVNSPSNSAAPGDYLAIFGTGLNTYPIKDGTYATGPWTTTSVPGLTVHGISAASSYSGLAPLLVGVDQLNFQIPNTTAEGCAVPISISQEGLIGPTVDVSVHSGRGQCVDPPIQSYGQVVLTKTVSSGTNSDGVTETLTASFPSGPGLTPPPQQLIPSPGSYIANVFALTSVSRSCLSGYPQLSAGAINVQAAATGQTITTQPTPASSGVVYQQSLPTGFIAPGQYNISASGTPVTFQGRLSVGSPIQIQTPFPAGTKISSSQLFVVKWTGGDPGTLVKSSLSTGGLFDRYDFAVADAPSGSITFAPICVGNPVPAGNGVVCSFGLTSSNNAQVVVEVLPAPSTATYVTADGITGTVQLSWAYRYVFGGLVLQ